VIVPEFFIPVDTDLNPPVWREMAGQCGVDPWGFKSLVKEGRLVGFGTMAIWGAACEEPRAVGLVPP
jgi:hypothetical protein